MAGGTHRGANATMHAWKALALLLAGVMQAYT
jgi:hypothetical protein